MRHCDLTLPRPEENLACDEALLELCEAGGSEGLLRFWQPAQHFVVVGYSNTAAREVNLPFCQQNTIPVLRRCTGGGTVLQGPGCLNYALILPIEGFAAFQSISATNQLVLERHQTAVSRLLGAPVQREGQTDLAIGGLKFCGNAQRRQKRFLLFHGSFLLRLDLELMERALPLPSRQPAYRGGRAHSQFLMNLNLPADRLKTALADSWNATQPLGPVPFDRIAALTEAKYAKAEWNLRL